jgi:hypothetical protein
MPQWNADELTALVSDDILSETITYTPAGGAASTISAIIEDPSINIQMAMGAVASDAPKVTCKTSDVSSAKKGDAVTARSVNYTVTEANPDGTGMTELVLTKA